jgi:DNA processing protein
MQEASRAWHRHARRLLPGDPSWPAARLDALSDPPAALRVCGTLPPLEGAVAVVGTRYADDDALEFARALGAGLASAGRTVVSGGALGIDAAAHRGALDVGGPTIAVLASGFDPPFPRQHRALFGEIARSGAVVSEREDGGPPARWTFLDRNRLIAALADVVVVVQAPHKSGALNTAAHAGRLQKRIFTVPYAPWEVRGQGCLALLRRGAEICTSARDVLSVPAHEARRGHAPGCEDGEKATHVDELEEDERAVWGLLGARPKHPDDLSAKLGMPVMDVQRVLLQLLLRGLAAERGPGRYVRNVNAEQR